MGRRKERDDQYTDYIILKSVNMNAVSPETSSKRVIVNIQNEVQLFGLAESYVLHSHALTTKT